MKHSWTICKKELNTFFKSPVGYITFIVFSMIATWFFIMPFFASGNASLSGLFHTIQLMYLAFIPVITMGLIAKERNTGTIETLMTLPLRIKDLIIGKYLFAISIVFISLLLTLPHFLTVFFLGQNVDYGVILCAYIGSFLIGSVYSSIGIFTSSISNNQIIAFILSFVISLFLFSIEFALLYVPHNLLPIFQYLSITWQYSNLVKGVIDSRVIVYFVSLIFIFLYLSIELMSSKKKR